PGGSRGPTSARKPSPRSVSPPPSWRESLTRPRLAAGSLTGRSAFLREDPLCGGDRRTQLHRHPQPEEDPLERRETHDQVGLVDPAEVGGPEELPFHLTLPAGDGDVVVRAVRPHDSLAVDAPRGDDRGKGRARRRAGAERAGERL